MMFQELNPNHFDETLFKYMRVLVEEMNVTLFEFDDFIQKIKNRQLRDGYSMAREYIYNDN